MADGEVRPASRSANRWAFVGSGRGSRTVKQALPTLSTELPSGVGSDTGISSITAAAVPPTTVTSSALSTTRENPTSFSDSRN